MDKKKQSSWYACFGFMKLEDEGVKFFDGSVLVDHKKYNNVMRMVSIFTILVWVLVFWLL